MTNSIQQDFDSFIDEISLNKKEKDDIIKKHNHLTDMIKQDPPEGYKIVKTRLSGSYAKHTTLNEYDDSKLPDVDVIVIIESDEEDVDKINSDFLSYFRDKKGAVVSEIRQQSNSIGFIYSNISVDIVIAKEIEKKDVIKITSHKEHTWVESNSLLHVSYMKDKNLEYEGFSYYGFMKLLKYLNKETLITALKSYTLEQLVHKCIPTHKSGLRIYQAFAQCLENISNLDSIEEITDCCDDTKKGYDEKDKEAFKEFKCEIKKLSDLANDALNGKRKNWEIIFGERFPEQPKEPVEMKDSYDKSQTPYSFK